MQKKYSKCLEDIGIRRIFASASEREAGRRVGGQKKKKKFFCETLGNKETAATFAVPIRTGRESRKEPEGAGARSDECRKFFGMLRKGSSCAKMYSGFIWFILGRSRLGNQDLLPRRV